MNTKLNCCPNCTNRTRFNYIRTVEVEKHKVHCFECCECSQLILKKDKK